MIQNNQTYYLSYNHIGSLRAVTKEDGTIVKEIEYSAYGEIVKDTNETLQVNIGFAGGLYDSDTKLTRFGYRDYDAKVGKDPIGFGGGDINLYGYVLGDPVNGIDPLGLAYNYNGIDWGDYKGKGENFRAFLTNGLLKFHAFFYNNSNAYTIIEHGYQGYSEIENHLQEISEAAKQSGRGYIELSICEIGQGNIPNQLHKMSGLPVKYSEDYVQPAPYGIGSQILSNSPTAKIHGWQWIK